MTGLRNSTCRRLGAALGGVAVYLQLMLASFGLAAVTPAAPADALGLHALCLAAAVDAGAAPAPIAPAPAAPAHDHAAFCCPWHTAPAVPPLVATLPRPLVYASVAAATLSPPPLVATRHVAPLNARAPPTLS